MVRDRTQLRVRINGTSLLDDSLTSFRPLQAQVMYLGGLPPSARLRRQTLASQLSSGSARILEARNFKGVLQDIQVTAIFFSSSEQSKMINVLSFNKFGNYSTKINCVKVKSLRVKMFTFRSLDVVVMTTIGNRKQCKLI